MLYFALIALIVIGIAGMFYLVNDVREMNAYLKALDNARDQRADGDCPHLPPALFHSSSSSRERE